MTQKKTDYLMTVMERKKARINKCPKCDSSDHVIIFGEYPKTHCLACNNVYSAEKEEEK